MNGAASVVDVADVAELSKEDPEQFVALESLELAPPAVLEAHDFAGDGFDTGVGDEVASMSTSATVEENYCRSTRRGWRKSF